MAVSMGTASSLSSLSRASITGRAASPWLRMSSTISRISLSSSSTLSLLKVYMVQSARAALVHHDTSHLVLVLFASHRVTGRPGHDLRELVSPLLVRGSLPEILAAQVVVPPEHLLQVDPVLVFRVPDDAWS